VILVKHEDELHRALQKIKKGRMGVLLPTEWAVPAHPIETAIWGSWSDTPALAHALFEGLRTLDARGVEIIFCPIPKEGSGPLAEAIRDRLMKAAKPA
jgi:L-threonylcarbamoyladenylate synthase